MTANQQVTKQQCVRHKLEGGLKIVLMEFWLSILCNAVRYLCCFRMSPLSLCRCWNIILDVQYSVLIFTENLYKSEGMQFYESQPLNNMKPSAQYFLFATSLFLCSSLFLSLPSLTPHFSPYPQNFLCLAMCVPSARPLAGHDML